MINVRKKCTKIEILSQHTSWVNSKQYLHISGNLKMVNDYIGKLTGPEI